MWRGAGQERIEKDSVGSIAQRSMDSAVRYSVYSTMYYSI
jgi:hypothetical protein